MFTPRAWRGALGAPGLAATRWGAHGSAAPIPNATPSPKYGGQDCQRQDQEKKPKTPKSEK